MMKLRLLLTENAFWLEVRSTLRPWSVMFVGRLAAEPPENWNDGKPGPVRRQARRLLEAELGVHLGDRCSCSRGATCRSCSRRGTR